MAKIQTPPLSQTLTNSLKNTNERTPTREIQRGGLPTVRLYVTCGAKSTSTNWRDCCEWLFSLLIDCAYIQDQETSPKGHVPLGWPIRGTLWGGSSPNGNYPLITELTKYYTNWSLINYFSSNTPPWSICPSCGLVTNLIFLWSCNQFDLLMIL